MPKNQLKIGGKLTQFPEDMSLEDINKVVAGQKRRAGKLHKIIADLVDEPGHLEKIFGKLEQVEKEIARLEKTVKKVDTISPTETSTKQMLAAIQGVDSKILPPSVVDFTEVLAAVKGIKIPKPRAEKKPKGIKIIREEGVIVEGRFIF